MNILFKILPLILCLCFLAGCKIADARASNHTKNPQKTTDCALTDATFDPAINLKQAGEDIYYCINSSSATECSVHIVSMSCEQMTFGKAFYLEKKTDGGYKKVEWKEMPSFIEIACLLTCDQPADEKYSWKDSLGELEKGSYRIVVDFYRNGQKITAYFEFEV